MVTIITIIIIIITGQFFLPVSKEKPEAEIKGKLNISQVWNNYKRELFDCHAGNFQYVQITVISIHSKYFPICGLLKSAS